ncbi:MAG: hypothetical protein IJY98_06150 [Bacteroidaceae bacterium]|nr:hypothetical protein [Bacteroidaceae bacterium]
MQGFFYIKEEGQRDNTEKFLVSRSGFIAMLQPAILSPPPDKMAQKPSWPKNCFFTGESKQKLLTIKQFL